MLHKSIGKTNCQQPGEVQMGICFTGFASFYRHARQSMAIIGWALHMHTDRRFISKAHNYAHGS